MENFLNKKFNLTKTTAAEQSEGLKPKDKIENYLDRLENIVEDERGYSHIRDRYINHNTLDISGDNLEKLAIKLYNSEKQKAINEGRKGDIPSTLSPEILEKYKEEILEKKKLQEESLKNIFDYVVENEDNHPKWFRYFILRSVTKMGILDKDEKKYTHRTDTSVAPFINLNHEAVGFVRQTLEKNYDIKNMSLSDDDIEKSKDSVNPKQTRKEMIRDMKDTERENYLSEYELRDEQKEELLKKLETESFSDLYAFAQIEVYKDIEHLTVDGEWKKFDKDSDPNVLVNTLGKGTGWCTAVGSAPEHLRGGDFYVYYTYTKEELEEKEKGIEVEPTQPGIAIRMLNGEVYEVKGTEPGQNLSPELVDVAAEKYEQLPGGDKWEKKRDDMNRLTSIYSKFEEDEEGKLIPDGNVHLSKEDLRFLYEIDNRIESFGHSRDIRIQELLETRNTKEDMLIIFEYTKEQIATDKDQINEDTKAYLGEWNIDIYNVIKQYPNIKHLYESFPEKKIFMYHLETNPDINSPEKAEQALKNKSIFLSDYGKDILDKTEFSKERKEYELVQFTVKQLGLPDGATTDEIYDKAKDLGLELCPAEVGPHLRLNYEGADWKLIAMKQITDRDGHPNVFRLDADGGDLRLDGYGAKPDYRRHDGGPFVFSSSK